MVYCGLAGGIIVGVPPMLGGDFVEFRPSGGVLGRGDGSDLCASVPAEVSVIGYARFIVQCS